MFVPGRTFIGSRATVLLSTMPERAILRFKRSVELQPDFIKMDRSLVHNLHRNKTKEYILETMLTFAQKLGIYLIAEGIETREELIKLTRMGIHYGQGYLLGRPGQPL